MKLHTERLIIVPCTNELIIEISEEYKIGPHILDYLKKLSEDSSLLGWGAWLVIQKENNKIIGDIGFKGKPDLESSVEVGYGMVPEVHGNGYATEAVNKLIEWALSFEHVNKVKAECLTSNTPSIRVLEKVGMEKTRQENDMFYWEVTK
ncbi:GNAT family N-acetyltransferase [Bacillus sp. AK128]